MNMEANAIYQMNKDLHLVIETTITLEMVMKHSVVGMEVQGKLRLQPSCGRWRSILALKVNNLRNLYYSYLVDQTLDVSQGIVREQPSIVTWIKIKSK